MAAGPRITSEGGLAPAALGVPGLPAGRQQLPDFLRRKDTAASGAAHLQPAAGGVEDKFPLAAVRTGHDRPLKIAGKPGEFGVHPAVLAKQGINVKPGEAHEEFQAIFPGA
jgi:hypothetical protein